MSDSLTFNYIRTIEDYWRAFRAHRRIDSSRWFVRGSGALLVVVLIYAALYEPVAILVVVPIAILKFGALFVWHRKVANDLAPCEDEEIWGTADNAGVKLRGVSCTTEYPWSDFVDAIETPGFFFLFLTRSAFSMDSFMYIPKWALREKFALSGFRELVRAHVPDFRAKAKG